MDLSGQLSHLLATRLLDPLEILLQDDQPVGAVRDLLTPRVAEWVRVLEGDDDTAAVHLIARLIGTLHPGDQPFNPPADWWRSPFGRIVLRRAGHPYATSVSYATAGAMLGITRQAVHDLVRRGRLPRDPDGGVPVTAIRARLTSEGKS